MQPAAPTTLSPSTCGARILVPVNMPPGASHPASWCPSTCLQVPVNLTGLPLVACQPVVLASQCLSTCLLVPVNLLCAFQPVVTTSWCPSTYKDYLFVPSNWMPAFGCLSTCLLLPVNLPFGARQPVVPTKVTTETLIFKKKLFLIC